VNGVLVVSLLPEGGLVDKGETLGVSIFLK